MQPYELWYERFKPALSFTPHWDTMDHLMMVGFRRRGVLQILATGSGRVRQGFEGCAPSDQWKWLTENGFAKVVVVEPDADTAYDLRQKCPGVDVIQRHAVSALTSLTVGGYAPNIDIFYCGSGVSVAKIIAEVDAAWESLLPGAFVAIEEPERANSPMELTIAALMAEIGAKLVRPGKLSVWQKAAK